MLNRKELCLLFQIREFGSKIIKIYQNTGNWFYVVKLLNSPQNELQSCSSFKVIKSKNAQNQKVDFYRVANRKWHPPKNSCNLQTIAHIRLKFGMQQI